MPYNSSDNKDQLRLLKGAMQSRLTSTFRPRRSTLVEQDLTIAPSPTDSECSTLIDFATEGIEAKEAFGVVYEEEADRAVMLEEDNCAWINEKAYNAALKANRQTWSKSPFSSHVHAGASDMIDEDDRAWCMPPKQPKSKSKQSSLFSFSHRRQKLPNGRGLEPQMLDPEDRAWM